MAGFAALISFVGSVIAYNGTSFIYDNLFHLGEHVATHIETFESPENWNVCEEIPKTLVTRNDSTHDIRVRLSYDEYWRAKNGTTELPLSKDGIRLAIISFQNENDWEDGGDGWFYYKEALAPGESTTSYFKSVKLDCSASFGGANVCHETATGFVCEKPEDAYENAKYHLNITVQTSDEEFQRDNSCHVKINPNGGLFNGSSDVYEADMRCGGDIDLRDIVYEEHELTGWTKNSTDTFAGTEIRIDGDIELVANWLSTIRYNITVDPNGGSYGGSTEPTSYEVRKDSTFMLGNAVREGYFVDYWQIVGDGTLTDNSLLVDTDGIVLQAHWDKAVARIERTQKIYNSIMAAHAEAQAGDIITLLVDTEENVTNEKNVTLDLNGHTITGTLINTTAGNITLINGEINNPNGVAAANDGILTMGIDDYGADGVANVISDNVRLIGTTVGLKQTNDTYKFYFYDGYIEGDIGLQGGYDGAPFYRRAYDDFMVYYFPLVERMEAGDRIYQHVELKNADRAVTKTSVHGDIYYYNMQDNINVSALTGYKIYAVRDFDASYPLTVASGDTIYFDIAGYNVDFSEVMTNNGSFNIENSGENGRISAWRTIQNNSELSMTNARVEAASANTLINNRSNIHMANSVLTSGYGTTMIIESGANTTLDLDDDSLISSTSSSPAINNNSVLTISGGHILGSVITIKNAISGTVNVTGGIIETTNSDFDGGAIVTDRNYNSAGYVNITGGQIVGISSAQYAMRGGHIVIDGGNITIETPNTNAAINYAESVVLRSGLIKVKNTNSSNYASASGINYTYSASIEGGRIEVESRGYATGINGYTADYWINVRGGEIYTHSLTNTSQGVYGLLRLSGGSITAVSDSGAGYGVSVPSNRNVVVTGGTLYGSSYGVSGDVSSYGGGSSVTIGINDDSLYIETPVVHGESYGVYGADIYFYDGILKGGAYAYQSGRMKAIADATEQKIERNDSTEDCWLIESENYLEVDGVEYNSLKKAYNAVADGGTIKVIKDFSTSAVAPTNPSGKTIYFDINGHSLSYTQPLSNSGVFNFIDNSDEQNGILTNTGNPVLINSGSATINVLSGKLLGYGVTIRNDNRGNVVNVSGGTIEVINAYSAGGGAITSTYSGDTVVNLTGGNIIASGSSSEALYNLGTAVIDGANITVESSGGASATFSVNNIRMKSGTVKVKTNSGSAYGFNYYTNASMMGGRLEVNATNSNGTASGFDGWSSYCMSISGGEVIVHSVGQTSRGIATCMSMSGGSVAATSDNGTAYGIYIDDNRSATVTGGTVFGSSYGIYGKSGSTSVTIGTNNDALSIADPIVQGGGYGVYNASIYFYDGILKGKTSAYQDGKIVAIPDATSQHSERIDEIDNCWLIESAAYLEVDGVRYNSVKKAYNAVADGGTVKVVEDFTTSAAAPANPSGKTITFDINGHRLTNTQPLPNNGTMNFIDSSDEQNGVLINMSSSAIANNEGGTFNMISGKILGYESAIRGTGTNTINIRGGLVEATHTRSSYYGVIYQPGTGDSTTVNVLGGTVLASGDSSVGIYNIKYLNIDGGSIIVDSTNSADVTFSVLNINLRSGLAKATTTGGSASGFNYFTNTVIEGGRLEVTTTSSQNGYANGLCGWSDYNLAIRGGEVVVYSTYGQAKGVSVNLNMSGGSVSAVSDHDVGYGIFIDNSRWVTVTGGSVYGSTYGIVGDTRWGKGAGATLGVNDETLSATNPSIRGGSYALYNLGSANFYDGILRGGVAAYNDNVIKNIAPDTYMYMGRDEYEGSEYDTRYLMNEHDIAQIGSTKYTSLKNAISAAEVGDTIELLEDNYIFNSLTVPSGKDVVIDLSGYNIITGNPITNNGKIKIINSNTETNPLITYYDGTMFVNNADATLEFVGLRARTASAVDNKGNATLIMDGVEFTSTNNSVVNNEGNLIIKNGSTLNTSTYNTITHKGQSLQISDSTIRNGATNVYNTGAIYISSGTTTIDNSTVAMNTFTNDEPAAIYQYASTETILNNITTSDIVNNSGLLTVNGGSITTVGQWAPQTLITGSNSTTNLNNTTLASITDYTGNGESNPRSVVVNAGILNVNSSTIRHEFSGSVSSASRGITNTGTAVIRGNSLIDATVTAGSSYDQLYSTGIYNQGSLTLESGTITSNRKGSRGIYNASGTTIIKDVTINLNGQEVYGLYVAGGTVIMGEAEPTDSADYGKATAHVSTTSPSIRAIGSTTGVGIKKTQGVFNFYDGIATGSTAAEPEPPTNVEYLYEPTYYTDGDGYQYVVLEFMR